jgi:HEAT repeat protein
MMLLSGAGVAADAQLDAAFKAAVGYRPGMGLRPIEKIERAVRQVANDPAKRAEIERRLITLLRSPQATFHARQFACQQLHIIGTKQCVPAVASLLCDPSTVDMACYALCGNPSVEAGQVLLNALHDSNDAIKPILIHVLVQRNNSKTIPVLAALVESDDRTVAVAAIGGLGFFADSDAARALRGALQSTDDARRAAAIRSLLACADALAATGNVDQAVPVFQYLFSLDQPLHVRRGALFGLMRYGGRSGEKAAMAVLAQGPPQLQSAVVARAGLLTGDGVIEKLLHRLDDLDALQQSTLIAALVEAHGGNMRLDVSRLAEHESEPVRVAAFEAMGRIGDAEFVERLVEAVEAAPAERNAALAALAQLPEGRAATMLIAKAKSAPKKVQLELVDVLAARHSLNGLSQLIESTDDDVAVAALGAFAHLADKDALDNLFLVLTREGQSEERRVACKRAIVTIARNRNDESATVDTAISRLKEAKNIDVRCSLLRVLGGLPDDKSYAALVAASDGPDDACRATALRQLFAWPDSRALPALANLVNESPNQVHRVLALRALVRLAGHEDVPADDQLEYLRLALKHADQPDKLKLVISGLGAARSADAIDALAPFLDNQSVRPEAELAMLNVAGRVLNTAPEKAIGAARKLQTKAQNEPVRKQAAALIAQARAGEGYVTAWQISGPFQRDGATSPELFVHVFPPESLDTSNVNWRSLPVKRQSKRPWMLDLGGALGRGNDRVCYVRTAFHCQGDRPALLEFGTDDGSKIWLNGELVYADAAGGAAIPGEHKVDVNLQKGRNSLLLKITQQTGPWEFCLRVTDRDGAPLEGLRLDPARGPAPIKPQTPRTPIAATAGPWTPLFDGKSLAGWSATGDAVFKVEDGCLVGTQTSGRGGDLWHEGEFDNFELRFTYRMVWPGNSGIWFRHGGKNGYQYDLLKYKDPVAFSGTLYCHGKMFLTRNLDESLENRDGWNEARLRAVGNDLTLWLNDTEVGHVQDSTLAKGRFGIQVHGGDNFKGMKIIVRKMEVRTLTRRAEPRPKRIGSAGSVLGHRSGDLLLR